MRCQKFRITNLESAVGNSLSTRLRFKWTKTIHEIHRQSYAPSNQTHHLVSAQYGHAWIHIRSLREGSLKSVKTKYFPNSQAIPSRGEVNRLTHSWLLLLIPLFSKRNVGILLVCEAEMPCYFATLYGHKHSTSQFASQSFYSSSFVAYLDVYISYVLLCFLFGPDSTPTHNIDLVGLLVDFFFQRSIACWFQRMKDLAEHRNKLI